MRVASNASAASAVSAASSMMSARSGVATLAHGDPSSTWEMWDTIRAMCGYHPRLSVSECKFHGYEQPLLLIDFRTMRSRHCSS